jgi:protein involved in polysaccharide export with SLBB domain
VIYLYPAGALDESAPVKLAEKIAPSRDYDESSRIQIDIERLYGGLEKRPLYVPVMDGDLIVVPPPPRIHVYGEVTTRSPQGIQAARPYLLSVLSAAGGLTFSAEVSKIEIFRELQFGKKTILTLDLEQHVLSKAEDIKLRDGDIIYVPSNERRYYQDHAVRFVNQLLIPVTMVSSGVAAAN